ncbi:unnamed protein product [Bursaphelenchus okinawaensis]|uniref:WD_REPEATS_REGION domain-containing protein n=1 Tax=Bursaphelenchus okinawaensis TaxID=465554 RepID=A0A811LR92_9BILA|nr:unnamed protein product [Bursaphelenchus okinawaensis]CAG9127570.1 unnamed protein product [Bursaphelenchus okinawaensis]
MNGTSSNNTDESLPQPGTSSQQSQAVASLDSLRRPENVDQETIQEFLIHIHGFLKSTGLSNVADALGDELNKRQFVPPRIGFDGSEHTQSLTQFLSIAQPYSTNLLELFSRTKELTNSTLPQTLHNSKVRLFTTKRTNLARRNDLNQHFTYSLLNMVRPKPKQFQNTQYMNILNAREMGLKVGQRILMPKTTWGRLQEHGKFLGHLSQVFCVCFDRTGRYVVTGGDDKLIKVWDTVTGLLRYTFRGHEGEIADLSINLENTCLASGSTDKTVRVWSLTNGQPLMIFKNHKALIMAIHFLPFYEGNIRWLVSSSSDCKVVFYRYDADNLVFESTPYEFEERAMSGAKMVAASYSSGGNFVITGGTEKLVYIYKLSYHKVDRVYEFMIHNDKIESLVWANNNFWFASGSKDGTAKIWSLQSNEWHSTDLVLPKNIEESAAQSSQNASQNPTNQAKKAFKLNMLCWSSDDTKVISIGNDFFLRVSDARTGELLKRLEGHTQNAYVIKSHPVYNEVIVSAGHDGQICVGLEGGWGVISIF